MITILRGDTSQTITLAMASGYDYTGATVRMEYQSAVRTFTDCTAGGYKTFAFTAAETARFALGTYPLKIFITLASGDVKTPTSSETVKVTDTPSEVAGGSAISVALPLAGITGLGEVFTESDIRTKLNSVITQLGGSLPSST